MVRVYLDELQDPPTPSLVLGMVTLVVEERQSAIDKAHQLIQQAKQQLVDEGLKQKVVGLIETIMVYKLTDLTTQEIEAMFGLDELKQTRYFQEVAAKAKLEGQIEGKLKAVPVLFAQGLTVQQIVLALELDVEQVRQVIPDLSNPDNPPPSQS